jgi:MFS family permease
VTRFPEARGGASTPARLHRDGVTGLGYLSLATFGWFLYGYGALLPQLGRDQGISRTVTSLHSVTLAVGALVAGMAGVTLVRALRRRGVMALGAGLLTAGALIFAVGGAWTALTLVGGLVAGLGGSLLMNAAVPALSEHHGSEGPAAISEANAVAAATGLVAPLVVGAGIALGLTWRPAVLVTLLLTTAVIIVLLRLPRDNVALDAVLPPRDGPRVPLPRAFWPALIVVLLCVSVEFSTAAWSADLLRQRTGLSAGAAAAGVSAVIAGMTVGRAAVGQLALRHPPRRLLAGAILLAAAGWAVTWTATSAPLALAGLLITGVGIAGHFPMGASLVLAAAGSHQRDRAIGVQSMGIGVASGAGPFALGALADATSTHTAFLVVPVLLALALLMLTRTT